MSWASSETVSILTFLLPGFVAAAVFYSLTSHSRPNEFERIVQALIFTIVVQALVGVLQVLPVWNADSGWVIAASTKPGEIVVSVVVAVIFGLLAARFTNNDTLHRPLRFLRFTKENSYPTQWYAAFSRHPESYVVLHLKGERRLFGWPEEWPSRPNEGHFSITDCEWLSDDERIAVDGVSTILIAASDVEMVEFLSAEPSDEPTE